MDVYQLLQRRALVTRGAAQSIIEAIGAVPSTPDKVLELDFAGVEAVAPSFVDELISGLSASNRFTFSQLRIRHPPSRLSEKFRAIGRGRGLIMNEGETGEWIISIPSERT
jgi:hypothetical protein